MSKTDVKNLELKDKITVLKMYLKELHQKPKRFNLEYLSCFRTLNTIARYPYYWDLTTTTNAKFIQFLMMTKYYLEEFDDISDFDNLIYIVENYLPHMSRSYMTMYLVFKAYNKHRDELMGIKFPMRKVPYKQFTRYMNDMDICELDKIKKYLKKKKPKEELNDVNLWDED